MASAAQGADCDEVIAGLRSASPSIASKFLYDALGARLFTAITELDEYYLTRTEAAIVDANLQEIAGVVGRGRWTLIDIGAGDCAKAARLFAVLRPERYVAVDISGLHLQAALEALQPRFPGLPMCAVAADFTRGLAVPGDSGVGRRLLHFPGSSIGNFTPIEAQAVLSRLRSVIDDTGGMLIGFDLAKDADVLRSAYDDALGVTAAFNLNVLRHANRIAGTDFELRDWRHVAQFDAGHGRIEMYVEARRDLEVSWTEGGRGFAAGERIRTEYSYKYTLGDLSALLASAGFSAQAIWTDDRHWFAYVFARPFGRVVDRVMRNPDSER